MKLLRFLLYVIDGTVVLLFIGAYMARYVHPRYVWWLQLLAVGLPVLSLAVVVLAPVPFLSGHRGLGVLHLLLIGLAGFRYFPYSLSYGKEVLTVDSLRVMSFNTRNVYPKAASETDPMIELVRRERPHLAGLQETWLPFQDGRPRPHEASVLVGLPGSGLLAARAPDVPHEGGSDLPILSRIGFEKHQILVRPVVEGHDLTLARAVIPWQGRSIAVYNVHLVSFEGERPWRQGLRTVLNPGWWYRHVQKYGKSFVLRAREAETLKDLLYLEPLPYILCGDLNSSPDHWIYRFLTRETADAFRMAGKGWGATYPARRPMVRIDYILVSAHWKVLEAYPTNTSFSDHRPVMAVLTFADTREE